MALNSGGGAHFRVTATFADGTELEIWIPEFDYTSPPNDRFLCAWVAEDGSLYYAEPSPPPLLTSISWLADGYWSTRFAPSTYLGLGRIAYDSRKALTAEYSKPESPAIDVGSHDFRSAGSTTTALDPSVLFPPQPTPPDRETFLGFLDSPLPEPAKGDLWEEGKTLGIITSPENIDVDEYDYSTFTPEFNPPYPLDGFVLTTWEGLEADRLLDLGYHNYGQEMRETREATPTRYVTLRYPKMRIGELLLNKNGSSWEVALPTATPTPPPEPTPPTPTPTPTPTPGATPPPEISVWPHDALGLGAQDWWLDAATGAEETQDAALLAFATTGEVTYETSGGPPPDTTKTLKRVALMGQFFRKDHATEGLPQVLFVEEKDVVIDPQSSADTLLLIKDVAVAVAPQTRNEAAEQDPPIYIASTYLKAEKVSNDITSQTTQLSIYKWEGETAPTVRLATLIKERPNPPQGIVGYSFDKVTLAVGPDDLYVFWNETKVIEGDPDPSYEYRTYGAKINPQATPTVTIPEDSELLSFKSEHLKADWDDKSGVMVPRLVYLNGTTLRAARIVEVGGLLELDQDNPLDISVDLKAPALAVNREDVDRFPIPSTGPFAFCRYGQSNGSIGLQKLNETHPDPDMWDPTANPPPDTLPGTSDHLPGLAARAFGTDRLTFDDASGVYREASIGYYERMILNADNKGNQPLRARESVIHAQETNRDNLYMGYFLREQFPKSPFIDVFQISP